MTDEEKRLVEEAIKRIEKYGKGKGRKASEKAPVEVISTGIHDFDKNVLGIGGFPRGRIIELFGEESCIHGDSFINFESHLDDRVVNNKGGTIKDLYYKFHNIPRTGKGKYKRHNSDYYEYYIKSIDNDGRVIKNKLLDVKYNGRKMCYKVTTKNNNFELLCTQDHKFFVGDCYKPLYSLSEGDVIYVHNNTRFTKEHKKRFYKEVSVKYNPNWSKHVVNGHEYYRTRVHRAVIEANLNSMDYDDYINLLNDVSKKSIIDELISIPKNIEVHHIDDNVNNNNIDNLMMLTNREHGKINSDEKKKNLTFIAVEDTILKIEEDYVYDVFDLKCDIPYNNYIANKFIVHNCGKSTIAEHIVAEVQRQGGVAVYYDLEGTYDPTWGEQAGIDNSKLIMGECDYGEELYDQILDLLDYVDIIVVDSVSAIVSKESASKGADDSRALGLDAKLNTEGLKLLTNGKMNESGKKRTHPKLSTTKTIIIFINQLRDNMMVMYGPKTRTGGGRALKHYASVRLEMGKTRYEREGEFHKQKIVVKCVKNKLAPPLRECEFYLTEENKLEQDEASIILNAAIDKGIVTKSGSWLSYEGFDGKLQGVGQFAEWLENNPEFKDLVEC